jgi:hypothetical protein
LTSAVSGRDARAQALRRAALLARGGVPRRVRGPLVLAWLLLDAVVLLALFLAVPRPDAAPTEEAGAVQRLGPAEDNDVDASAAALEALAQRLVALAPSSSEEGAPPSAGAPESPAAGGSGHFVLTTGGPSQPLRAAPDPAAPLLVRVPDGARLDDLGEATPDGAWQRVAWEGWEGWIAAGLLRRR